MRVINPLITDLTIAASYLTASSVSEPDTGETAWNAATSYVVGDIVIRTTTHRKYRNVLAGVNATLPEVDAALATPTRWIEAGPTNKYAMFDTLRNTATVATSPLSVTLQSGKRVNSVGVLAMVGDSITIKVINASVEQYSCTQDLNTRQVLNWYDFFFEGFSNTPNLVKFDLPPYTAGEIQITITSVSGNVACGAVVIGNYIDVGRLQYGARIGATNFSVIEREFDGTAKLLQRQTKPKVSGLLYFEKANTNKVLALKESLNAIPTVWAGLDDDNTDGYADGLLVLGIYKNFEVDIAYPEMAQLDLEVEEI